MRQLVRILTLMVLILSVVACTGSSGDSGSATGDAQGTGEDTQEPAADEGSSPSDGEGVVSKTTALALGQLGLFRDARGVYAPAGMIAVVQGGLESPMFSCEESMDDEGNRVVACDYSGATVLDIDGTIPTGVRTETYDPEGRFMSWKWSDGAQYSCHYGETITCIFTSKEGEMCTDTFDYEGAFVKTTCEDDPLSIFSCSEEEGGGLLCDSELMNLSCYDRFDADLKLVEAGCGGLFNSSSACTVAGEAITCDVNWMGTDCDVEFDLLFNVESRSCVDLGDKCSWGDASKCGQGEGAPWVDPITDPCICAWRASALAVLCTDDFKVADTVDEPDTTDFISIVLSDARPIDGPMTDIWVDTEKLEFYVRITGSGHAGPDTVGPYWHGPFTLEDPECE